MVIAECLLTGQEQACSKITWFVVCLFVRHHAENSPIHRKLVVVCPLSSAIMITSKVKPRQQYQERGMNGPASLLHS